LSLFLTYSLLAAIYDINCPCKLFNHSKPHNKIFFGPPKMLLC
jgi:hypothetical protein